MRGIKLNGSLEKVKKKKKKKKTFSFAPGGLYDLSPSNKESLAVFSFSSSSTCIHFIKYRIE